MKYTAPIVPITLNDEVVKLINKSIGYEYQSHLFWNAAASWCAAAGYNKAAKYYAAESMSELEHVKKHQDFLIGWNVVPTIPQVPTSYKFESLADTINQSYGLMLEIFNDYVKKSQQLFAIDLSTFDYLQQFRLIQVDALNTYSSILSGLELVDYNNKLDVLFFESKYFKI